ncbi:MAG: nicotinamide-nucleotide amidohydrolase family protein [Magnetococcales bacterium]|nr:nicotinamide-nucleotide amidohydrolase family protein [Magnetococcales bacterium]
MKCLLVMPRWSEQGALLPPSGRPYLDLALECLGITSVALLELDGDGPFDPTKIPEEYPLILIQGDGQGGRLRRSLVSSLGLSLGLDGDDSDQLKVFGARALTDESGRPEGFILQRRGRMVAYCERSIWAARRSLVKILRGLIGDGNGGRRKRSVACWMVEGAGEPLDMGTEIGSSLHAACRVRDLPNGDAGLLIPATLGEAYQSRLAEQLGNRIYATSPKPLEEVVAARLLEAGVTVAVAESCTAGLVAARLSALPGSSAYLNAGWVTYANEAKMRDLGVHTDLLASRGAVSREVALAMSAGALRLSEADLAVAVTGIAGPEGGSAEKPVGTVHLAVRSRQGMLLEHRGFYVGSREQVRWRASQTALHLLRRVMAG